MKSFGRWAAAAAAVLGSSSSVVGAVDEKLGPNLIAELYSLSKDENLSAISLDHLAALEQLTTELQSTALSTTPFTARSTICGYTRTSECDVTSLFAGTAVAPGDILLLGISTDCVAKVPAFAAYSFGVTGQSSDGRVRIGTPTTLIADASYRLCQQLLSTGAVIDRGEVRFMAKPPPEEVQCESTDHSGKAKFLSLFDSVRCSVSGVDLDDAGYYYTVAGASCANFASISRPNMNCGASQTNSRCTFTLTRFEGGLSLCRCALPLPDSAEDAPTLAAGSALCSADMAEKIAVLNAPAAARRRLAALSESIASSGKTRRIGGSMPLLQAGSGDSKNLTASPDRITLKTGACNADAECGSYGRCVEKRCAGFYADQEDTKLIRCVEGYRCDVAGEISGVNINNNFQVIGVSPGEMCGTAEPLPPKLSIFSNQNRWRCSATSSGEFCQFSPGVGQRRNRTIALEGLRLCGCPDVDLDGNKIVCDSPSDFYVPLAKLGVQECLTNAHCLHKTFAYCVNDHCAGFMGIAASAGMKAYQCLLNKSCSVQSIAAKTINEGLKIVPVAASFSCGAEQALNPEFYEEHSLPCVMDINGDGHCDIHLGVPRALGTNRLCGCNGSDRGGNGRACDEPEDFDVDLGLLTVDECNMDADCSGLGVCVAKKCYIDSQAPYAVSIRPANGTEVVPPVTEVRISFSETIRFSTTQTDRRVVIMSQGSSVKYELPIADPTLHASSSDAHRVRIEGKDLVIQPDLRISSLPEGEYVVGFEGGIVEDLQGNGNIGSTDFAFTVTTDGGCPFLGVTGFGIDSSLNINGIYRSTGILNAKPKWTSVIPTIDGLNDNSQIFWYPGTQQTSGRWVIGLSHDHTKFLSYLDVPFPTDPSHPSSAMRPVSGSWKKWSRGKWFEQRNVILECIKSRVTTPPRFIDSIPLPGAVGISPTRLEMTFTFDRPVTYGHWSQIALTSVQPGLHEITLDPEDEDAVRNKLLFRNLIDNQMHVRLGDAYELFPGTEYYVTVDTGAFTDLQYNPVAPIVKGDFKFTTYGRSCRGYALGLYDHVEIEYDTEPLTIALGSGESLTEPPELRYQHDSTARIHCSENYSPRFKSSDLSRLSGKIRFAESDFDKTIVDVRCEDGEWDFVGLSCMADCAPYQTLGNQYTVEVIKLATDDNDLAPFGGGVVDVAEVATFKSGSQLKLSCAVNSETLAGSPLGEVTSCVNGRWSITSLRCGVTCPPFPDLGRAYTLAPARSSTDAQFSVGSSRTVSCNSDSLGDRGKTETIVCQEDGTWQTLSLNCYYNCPKLDLAGLSHSFGLIPITPALALSKSSKGRAGETHLFRCEDNSLAQIDAEEIDPLPAGGATAPLAAYWAEIDRNFPVSSERQTQISCVEGQWLRRRPLSCLKSCSKFVSPGPGYLAQLVLGDGTDPGSTYELQCKPDAITQRRSAVAGGDQIVCLKGEWTRISRRIECLGACVHPATYFGSNYRIIDQDSGLALAPVSPSASTATSYRHHSQSFSVECAQGMQPLDAPLVADPSLNYLRGKAPTDPDAPIRINDVRPLTGLFESPSQPVHCNDGEWIPTSSTPGGAGLIRCSPYCPPFNSLYSSRYVREDNAVGFSWGSKRQFKCAKDLTGGHFGRSDNGTLAFVPRPTVAFQCARGSWVAPAPPFETPELKVSYTLLRDGIIVKNSHSSVEAVQHGVSAALPCGRSCLKTSLEVLIRRSRLRIIHPSRASLPQRLKHGTLIAVSCEVGSTRISGPTESEFLGCSDGEWTLPLAVCGFPSCHDGALNQGEENVDCGGPNCSAACPANLHSCEIDPDRPCSACTALPEDGMLYTAESTTAGGAGKFITAADLPLAHGALIHAHYREYFSLPLTAVSDQLYVPYLCVNGLWEKLQATPRRQLEQREESATPELPSVSEEWQAASGAASTIADAVTEVALTMANDEDLPKELNGMAELAVQSISCNDGVLSRGEWGIDCGGVCPTPCPDCFDRVMNGQETWVDCDGPCRACSTCALADLKAYDGSAYKMEKIEVDLTTGAVSDSRGSATRNRPNHGEGLRISCSSSAVVAGGSLPLDLVCLDGRWWPLSLATEMMSGESDISPADFTALPMYAVRCELIGINDLEKAVLHKFRSPGITLDFCDASAQSEGLQDGAAPVSSFCCPLLASYNREMAGECGTLLYTGAVSGFCRGVCYQRLKQLTEFYDTLKEEAVARATDQWDRMTDEEQKQLQVCERISDRIKVVSKSFCYTNAEGSGSAGSSEYCFSAAGANLGHLRTLDLYTKASDISIACKKKSCFRSNVEYVDTMWQLIHMPEIRLAGSSAGTTTRRLSSAQDITADIPTHGQLRLGIDKEDPEDQYLTHLSTIKALRPPSEQMAETIQGLFSMAEMVETNYDGEVEVGAPLEADWAEIFEAVSSFNHSGTRRLREDQCPRRRRLAGVMGVAPVIGSIFRDPASVQYSDTVVPLMCLRDSRGDPCTKQFQQMIQGLTLWSGQTSMTSSDRVKLGQAVAGLAATCNESSCFLQLSRHLGQEVSERGIARGDPYQRFMGLFLKLFGRYFCQNDSQGGSCAVKYLGWLVQGMQPAPARTAVTVITSGSVNGDLTRVMDKTAEIRALVTDCKCPTNYINDGICDPQCFNVNCAFDGGDCLVQSMYPGILQRLMTPIPLSNPCHPLNDNLKTCPKDFACHKAISSALINHGCCFAVGVDMLKEVLDLEFYSHPMIRPDSQTYLQAADYFDMETLRQLLLEQFGQVNGTAAGIMQPATTSINFALSTYEHYTPDRSSIYSQTLCNLYQDRTCSRGMARRVLAIYFETNDSPSFDALAWMMLRQPPSSLRLTDFPYDSLDYDTFREAVEKEVPILRLKVLLRKQLSDILVLPSTDVREVDIWPSQTSLGKQALIEIIVDPSLFVDETRNTLQTMQDSGEFQELISATVAQWRQGISDVLEKFLSIMESRSLNRVATTHGDKEDQSAEQAARRHLAEPVEVDQRKAMLISVERVRQMPITRIRNVQFKILTLDPITVGSTGNAVDSLAPSEGTFDLGYIAGVQRVCSPRTLMSDHDPWGGSSLPFSNYIVTPLSHGASLGGYDGEALMISCKGPTFAAKAGSQERQKVVCSNGRWISADREVLLECLKPCSHFHLQTPTPDVYRVVGDGHSSGSTRRVSCASGYTAASSAASELLVCNEGQWSELSLQCKRTTVFDGVCAGVPLDFLVNNFHYKMTTQTNGAGTALSMPNSLWWKAICQRGYEAKSGTEPLYLVCLDDQRLLSFGLMSYHLQQKVLKPPSAQGLESALRQFIADAMPTGQLAEVDLARLIWSTELPLKTSGGAMTPDANLTKLVCTESVITKPELLVEGGIDDWVYIGVVAGIAFGATLLFGLWGYYWQTRGRLRRNTRKAKRLAAAAHDNPELALLAEPTAAGVPPKYPSTEASELFPSSKFPPGSQEQSAPSGWPQRQMLPTQQGLVPRRDDHSSNGYYSDVEYYAKNHPE